MLDPGPSKGEGYQLWGEKVGFDAQLSQESIMSSIVGSSSSSGSSGSSMGGAFGPKSEQTKQQRRSEHAKAEAVGSYVPYECSSAANPTHLEQSKPTERFGPSAISKSPSTFPNFLKNKLD